MRKFFLFSFLVFALTGLLTPSLMLDSFADTNNNGRDQGKKTANGCEKGTAKNNPNCNTSEPPSGTAFTACDTDSNGGISSTEIANWVNQNDGTITADTIRSLMSTIFESNSSQKDTNDMVDTQGELDLLNSWLNGFPPGIPSCV